MPYKHTPIIRNSVECLKCGDEVVSLHRHHFKSCSCGNVCVDGGTEYTKRVFKTNEWKDTSIYGETETRLYSWEKEE